MQVAVLIDCRNLLVTNRNYSLGLIRKVYLDASTLGLDIDERDVVLLGHGVCHTSYLDLDFTTIEARNHGNVLLVRCINSIRNKLLHLLAAAYNGNLRIYYLLYYIAAVTALIKLCCLNIISFY